MTNVLTVRSGIVDNSYLNVNNLVTKTIYLHWDDRNPKIFYPGIKVSVLKVSDTDDSNFLKNFHAICNSDILWTFSKLFCSTKNWKTRK